MLCSVWFLELGPTNLLLVLGKTIATILCDGAYRYQSRLFSRTWLKAKGLEDAIPEHLKKYAVLN